MNPYNRRYMQAIRTGPNEPAPAPPPQPPPTQQTNMNPFLNSPFVNLRGSPLRYSFNDHPNSTDRPASYSTFGLNEQERPSMVLSRQLQAGGGALSGSHLPWATLSSRAPPYTPYLGNDEIIARELQAQEGTPSGSFVQNMPWTSSSSQPVPSIGEDERIARELQAQFEAEVAHSNANATSSGWTYQNDSLAGSSSGLTASMGEDERLAYQLEAELNGEDAYAFGQAEVPSQYMDGLDYGAPQDHLSAPATQSFAQQIARTECTGCRRKHFSAPLDLVRLFKKWLNAQAQPSSCLECPQCSTVTCVGCGTQTSTKDDINQMTVKGIKLGWCCDRGRLFLIWVLLCGFDHQQSCDARRNSYFRQNNLRPSNTHGGIGYGGDPFGPGYMQSYAGYMSNQRAGILQNQPQIPSQAEVASARVDGLTEQVLVFLTALLPTFERESDFDSSPPPDILSMLLDSFVLDKAAELLRNDSLEDATKRFPLYLCALDFVRALGSHYATAEAAVHSERNVKTEGVDLLKLSFDAGPNTKGKGKDDKTQSIASCLRNLNTQSNMMLQNAKANADDFQAPDSQQMLRLCRRISELADFLLANSRPVDNGGISTDKAAVWEQWQREKCLLDIPDPQILNGHHYGPEAVRMQSPPTGRMKRLMVDITHLKTGLPPGIFVRHGSSRLDVMKVLIVGPAGSPYEGGLFEFDLLCPFDYPNKPPKMRFRTTGGGHAHFNPNLYRDGKVCLSLLGTWQGETWRPGKSTLLQVFLSIQAMIFCDEPWCNEPGRETQTGTQMSKNYNKTIQALTVYYAMLSWLQANQNTIWNEVVSEHFKNNADTILKTVNQWAIDSSGSRIPAGFGVRAAPLLEMSQLAVQLNERLTAFRARQATLIG